MKMKRFKQFIKLIWEDIGFKEVEWIKVVLCCILATTIALVPIIGLAYILKLLYPRPNIVLLYEVSIGIWVILAMTGWLLSYLIKKWKQTN